MALAKQVSTERRATRSRIVSMKEAVVVKRVRGVSPKVIAVLPGEAGWVKRRVGQGRASAGVLALDAAGRVWQ